MTATRTQRTLAVIGAAIVVAGTVAVSVAAFTLSYDAIRSVGVAANIRPSWAWMLPVSVDGAMAVATVAVLLLRHVGRRTAYPWLVVAIGFVVSAGCNALHASLGGGRELLPAGFAVAVSVVPPLMLLLSIELLAVLTKALGLRDGEQVPGQTGGQTANSPARTGEQVNLPAPPVRPDSPRTDAPAWREQTANRLLPAPAEQARTEALPAHSEQVDRPEPVRPRPAPDPRREHARDLREQAEQNGEQAPGQAPEQVREQAARTGEQVGGGQTEQAPEQRGEQVGEQTGEQVEERPRPDDELIAVLRERAAEQIADRSLTRYRVEKITGASGRQAGRLLDAVLSAEQDPALTRTNGHSHDLAATG